MDTKNNSFVAIQVKPKEYQVTWGYLILTKIETDGKLSCYVPGYDIYYSAADISMAEKKGNSMTKLFLDHFFIHNRKNALKLLALELHKRGFKAEKDALTMKSLVRNIATNAKFKSNATKPFEFENAKEIHQHAKMQVAC